MHGMQLLVVLLCFWGKESCSQIDEHDDALIRWREELVVTGTVKLKF